MNHPPIQEELLKLSKQRPSWDDFYLGLAFVVSRRSNDVHTKHGCIITSSDNKVLSIGYNGFLAGLDDSNIPLYRPTDGYSHSKYDWVFHGEDNCIANSPAPINQFIGTKAFITGFPCFSCAKILCRAGVKEWVVADRHGHQNVNMDKGDLTKYLIEEQEVSLRVIKPSLNWLVDPSFIGELAELGFITELINVPPSSVVQSRWSVMRRCKSYLPKFVNCVQPNIIFKQINRFLRRFD